MAARGQVRHAALDREMVVRVDCTLTIFASGDADSRKYLPAHPGALQLGGNHVGGARCSHQVWDSIHCPVAMQRQIKDRTLTGYPFGAEYRDSVEAKKSE